MPKERRRQFVQSARRKTGEVSAQGNRLREEIARPERTYPWSAVLERGESGADEPVEQNESRGESDI